MRVKVDQIPEGLDRDHSPWDGFFLIQGLTEELLKRLVGALTELSQKLSIKPKMGRKASWATPLRGLSILGMVKTYCLWGKG